jgi:hypothetical protein
MDRKWIILLISVLVVTILYWTRFQVIEVHLTEIPAFYKINRVTGEISYVVDIKEIEVKRYDVKERR